VCLTVYDVHLLQTKSTVIVHPGMGHEGPEEQRYNSTLCLTSALDGGGWSMQCPFSSIPENETQYPLYRRLGGPQGQSAQVWKISPPPAFDPRLSCP